MTMEVPSRVPHSLWSSAISTSYFWLSTAARLHPGTPPLKAPNHMRLTEASTGVGVWGGRGAGDNYNVTLWSTEYSFPSWNSFPSMAVESVNESSGTFLHGFFPWEEWVSAGTFTCWNQSNPWNRQVILLPSCKLLALVPIKAFILVLYTMPNEGGPALYVECEHFNWDCPVFPGSCVLPDAGARLAVSVYSRVLQGLPEGLRIDC